MISSRALSVLALGTSLLACGARSSLDVGRTTKPGGPAAGSGGDIVVPPPGGAGPGAGGGSSCDDGPQFLDARSFFTLPGHVARHPQLIASSSDGSQVTLLARADPDPPIIDGNSSLTQVTFFPWQAWSGDVLGQEVLLFGGATKAVAPQRAADGISVIAHYTTFATGPGVVAIMDADAGEELPFAQPFAGYTGQPQFMTNRWTVSGSFGYGIVDSNAGGGFRSQVGDVRQTAYTLSEVSCDQSALRMDGVLTDLGFLAATWESCVTRTTELAFVLFDEGGPLSTSRQRAPAGIEQLYLLPRDDGDVWAIYQETGDSLVAQRLLPDGMPADSPHILINSPILATEVKDHAAVAQFGNGIAIAYFETGEDIPPTVQLQIYDRFGDQVIEERFDLPAPPSPRDRMDLLVNHAMRSVLLAWSSEEVLDASFGDARTYVMRVDCLPTF